MILHIPVPHFGHLPFIMSRPFFILVFLPSFISICFLHFTQYAVITIYINSGLIIYYSCDIFINLFISLLCLKGYALFYIKSLPNFHIFYFLVLHEIIDYLYAYLLQILQVLLVHPYILNMPHV